MTMIEIPNEILAESPHYRHDPARHAAYTAQLRQLRQRLAELELLEQHVEALREVLADSARRIAQLEHELAHANASPGLIHFASPATQEP